MNINDNEKFVKITDDPTKRIECKIQGCVRKIKNIIRKTEYLHLYPTGSSPRKVYRTAKIHGGTASYYFPASTLCKSNVILRLYFGNLRKLLSANVDGT